MMRLLILLGLFICIAGCARDKRYWGNPTKYIQTRKEKVFIELPGEPPICIEKSQTIESTTKPEGWKETD